MAKTKKKNKAGGVLVAGTLALALAVGGVFVFNNKDKIASDLDKVISLEQSLRNAEDEITSLKNTISDKDNLIANLRASNNSLYARVVELEQAWSNEKQISEEQKAYYDNEILRLNNLINDNNSEIAN